MQRTARILKEAWHHLQVGVGAVGLTLAFFLVLPLMQAISQSPAPDTLVYSVDAVAPPPPPPPPEEEPPDEPEQEEKPPELTEEAPPLDLSQLELALNAGGGLGEGYLPDFNNKLAVSQQSTESVEELFSLEDLDQKPRVVHQPGPTLTAQMKRNAPATVHVLFIVDESGRVQDAKVQSASNPLFEQPALQSVRKWKFEPGKRNGQSVRFRMRVPITFPKG